MGPWLIYNAMTNTHEPKIGGLREWLWPVAVACLSSAMVLAAITWGTMYPAHGFPGQRSWRPRFEEEPLPWIRWDARHYRDIAERGYDLFPSRGLRNVVFFPAYPFLSWFVAKLLRIPTPWGLLLTSNLLFVASMVIVNHYLQSQPWMSLRERQRWILLYCCWPASVFFRVGYSESLFLLSCVIFLASLRREGRWPLLAAAMAAGLAGATRVVGLALALVLAVEIVARRLWRSVGWATVAVAAVVAMSGVVAVSAYQRAVVGDALAFWHARVDWPMRPPAPFWDRLTSLLALEPLWRPSWYFDVMPHGGWYAPKCWFCAYVWLNPVTTFLFPALLWMADWKRLAQRDELLLGFLLWAIPYFGHGHENILLSQARYDLFIFPAYMTMIYVFRNLPAWAFGGLIIALSVMLLFFSYGYGAECNVF